MLASCSELPGGCLVAQADDFPCGARYWLSKTASFTATTTSIGDQFNSLEKKFNKETECLEFNRHIPFIVREISISFASVTMSLEKDIYLPFIHGLIIEHIACVRHGFIFNISVDSVVGEYNSAPSAPKKAAIHMSLMFQWQEIEDKQTKVYDDR